MTEDSAPVRLGQALKEAREALRLEQQEVGRRIGIGRGAMRLIERGEFKRVTPTIRKYAETVRWAPGSIEAVQAGGLPTVADPPEGAAAPEPRETAVVVDEPQELPLRIKAALASGPLLDAVVMDLPAEEGEDPNAQMVVIVKGRRDATPEQIQKALLEWERTEAQIRRTGGG